MAKIFSSFRNTQVADIPQDPGHYPNAIYSSQGGKYQKYWDYYTGEALDENCESGTTESGEPLKKYPLKVNLAKLAVQKVAFALLGEYDEKPITFGAKPQRKKDRVAEAIEGFLAGVWWRDNTGVGLLPEQARIACICGGCIFKIAKDLNKPNGVRLEIVQPDYFFPVWDSADYHHLLEVEVAYTIPTREAVLKYGYEPQETSGDTVLYREQWTEDEYEVTIGEQVLRVKGDEIKGKNPFIDPDTKRGIVPFEYFPVDRTGQFYGTSIIEQVKGLQDEYNARMADVGDAVNDGVHPMRYARNLPKNVQEIHLSRFKIKNLGMNAPNQQQPEVEYLDHPGLPKGTDDFLSQLLEDYRSVSHTPSVAYGIDEGSQRSALTLAFRMWPLTAFVRDTRGQWTPGFASTNRKVMIVARTIKASPVQDNWFGYELTSQWSPIIPRDREQLVNENVMLSTAKLRSPETALKDLGGIDDIRGEIEKIKEWQEYLAALGPQEGVQSNLQPPEIEPVVEE